MQAERQVAHVYALLLFLSHLHNIHTFHTLIGLYAGGKQFCGYFSVLHARVAADIMSVHRL